eukprot:s1479_g20.t1
MPIPGIQSADNNADSRSRLLPSAVFFQEKAEESDVCVGHGLLSALETYNSIPNCSHSHDKLVKCGRVKFCRLVSCKQLCTFDHILCSCCKVQSNRLTSLQFTVVWAFPS